MRSARSVTKLAACAASILALTVASLGLPAHAQDAAPAAAPAVERAGGRSGRSGTQSPVGKRGGGGQRRHHLHLRPGAAHAPADGHLGHAADPGEPCPSCSSEALRSLVDEHLQMQELRRVEVRRRRSTIIATDKEIDAEQTPGPGAEGNNMTRRAADDPAAAPAHGVGIDTLRRPDPRRDVSWRAWISGRFGRACGSATTRSRPSSAARPKRPASRSTRSAKCSSTPGASAAMEVGRERRQAADHPDAAGRALPGRGPPVLGLADGRQRRRRRLDRPRRDAARGRHGARAAAPGPAVGPDPGAATASTSSICATKRSGANDQPWST